FNVGTTTVTATVTDIHDNTNTCTFTVTVTDNEAPSISCPANITVNNDQAQCGAVVTFSATANDNCGVQSITYSPASGSFFPVGTTTVTATVTDIYGNTTSCTFSVAVVDNEEPRIACPGNIALNNDSGVCGARVAFTPPAIIDNCEGTFPALVYQIEGLS